MLFITLQSEDVCSVQCDSCQEKLELQSFSALTGELVLNPFK